MSKFFSVVVSCVDGGVVMGRSLVQGVPLECLKGLIIAVVNTESEQDKGSNTRLEYGFETEWSKNSPNEACS